MTESAALQQYKQVVYATAMRVQSRAGLDDEQITEILAKLDIDEARQVDPVREALRVLAAMEVVTDGNATIAVFRHGGRLVLVHPQGVDDFSTMYPNSRGQAIDDLLAKVKELGYDWKAVFGPRSMVYDTVKRSLPDRAYDSLADYKQRVYDLAASLKRKYSWCRPSFEEFIAELNIKIEDYNANDLILDLATLTTDDMTALTVDDAEVTGDIYVIRQESRFIVLSAASVEVIAIESSDDAGRDAAVKAAATKTLAHLRTLVPTGNIKLDNEDND